MDKSYSTLLEDLAPCPPAKGPVQESEAGKIVGKFKKIFASIGVDFNFSEHFLVDRLNDARNKPPISACEFDFVLTKFIRKMGSQLQDDAYDVRTRNVTPRGKQVDKIRPNNFEYGILSRSTKIAIILAVQPNGNIRSRHPVRVNIITIMRKGGFHVKQGEAVVVEGVEHTPEWIVVD